jgi:hypothetical protein
MRNSPTKTNGSPQVTLQLRLYALYHLNKSVLICMTATFVLCMIAAIVILGIVLSIQSGT